MLLSRPSDSRATARGTPEPKDSTNTLTETGPVPRVKDEKIWWWCVGMKRIPYYKNSLNHLKRFLICLSRPFLSLSSSLLYSMTRQESWGKQPNSKSCVTKICFILFKHTGEKANTSAILLIGFLINVLAKKACTLPGLKTQNKVVSALCSHLISGSTWHSFEQWIYFIRFTKLLICLQQSRPGGKCSSAVAILSFKWQQVRISTLQGTGNSLTLLVADPENWKQARKNEDLKNSVECIIKFLDLDQIIEQTSVYFREHFYDHDFFSSIYIKS